MSGGAASMGAGGENTLLVRTLQMDTGGTLDLRDNDVVVNYQDASPIGIWTGSSYGGITGMIKAGRIFSSSAGALQRLAVAEADDIFDLPTAVATASFSGQTVDWTSVLVKFTYGGDANLDGRINIDDYGRIDGKVSQSGSAFGWFNGDFNYDGKINIDDYGIIDGAVNAQGLPL